MKQTVIRVPQECSTVKKTMGWLWSFRKEHPCGNRIIHNTLGKIDCNRMVHIAIANINANGTFTHT